MKEKLQEALRRCEEMCADVEGRYPIGLLRVRRLLEEVLEEWWGDDDVATLPFCFPDNDNPAA